MMLWRVLAFLAVWLVAGQAHAQERRLLVAFEDSARALPQEQIRRAIALELSGSASVEPGGSEARSVDTAADRLAIALDAEGLWLKYQGPRGLIERHLPLPERAEQVPVVVSLAVGNLVREEAFELQRELERRRAAAATKPRRPPTADELARRRAFAAEAREASASKRRARRDSLVLSLGVDVISFGPITNPCTSASSDPKLECFADGSSYEPSEPPLGGTISHRYMLSGVRWSIGFGHEFHPYLSPVYRFGTNVLSEISTSYFWELHNRMFFNGALGSRSFRPFWYYGVGMLSSQVKVDAEVPAFDPSGDAQSTPRQRVEVVSKMSLYSIASGLGLTGAISDAWHIESQLGLQISFPDKGQGPALHASLGLAADF